MDILRKSPSPKEQVERASMGLVRRNPHLFAVDQPLNNDFLVSISAKTDLVFDDGVLELQVSLTRYKQSGEVTQEILLRDPNGGRMYRLDISSGAQTEDERNRMNSIEPSNQQMSDAIARMLNDTYGSSGNTTVSRHDNWAETTITTDSARKLIEAGELKLPEYARMTLWDLQQKMGNNFPLLG